MLLKVQNVMEAYVIRRTNTLYEEFSKSNNPFPSCSCETCRLETICHALNKIQPKYVVSGRGMNYVQSTLSNQTKTDIDAAIIDGMRVTNANKRPYHWKSTNFFRIKGH